MKKIMWCLAISLVPIVLTLAMYAQLPDRIPVHFNSQGQADGWGPPTVAIGFAFVPLALTLLFMLLPWLSPRRFETEFFASAWWTAANIIVGLVALLPLCLLWGAFNGYAVSTRWLLGAVAVSLVLLGNLMGKLRRNFWLGIRTPWTLTSEQVWYQTHRMGGKVIVICALLAVATLIAGLPEGVAVAFLAAAVLIPVGYSLVCYKRLERNGQLDSSP